MHLPPQTLKPGYGPAHPAWAKRTTSFAQRLIEPLLLNCQHTGDLEAHTTSGVYSCNMDLCGKALETQRTCKCGYGCRRRSGKIVGSTATVETGL